MLVRLTLLLNSRDDLMLDTFIELLTNKLRYI